MANDMVAITSSKLPAHLQGKTKVENPFAAAVGSGGFPVISIKGKVFHVQRGDERELVTKPGSDDEPAASLEVVILSTNPNRSKVFYERGYEEGGADKPDCYSHDGIAPAADAENPQSKKCAICPHNQWGSRISENGNKGKACADSMRLAVAPAGQLNDPMLLRVPAATLKVLGQYGSQLAKRGVEPKHVVTKIGFDYSVAYPALTFKAVRFVEEDEFQEIEQVLDEEAETIGLITGVSGGVQTVEEKQVDDAPAEAAPAKPAKSKKLKEAEEEGEVAPKKSKVKVSKPEPEPKAEPEADDEEVEAAGESEEPAASVEDYDDIDAALDDLDFDD